MPNLFLQNTSEFESHFDYDWEIAQWVIEDDATVTRDTTDADHPSCMKVVEDTDTKGVYYDVTVEPSTRYVCEFAYKLGASQELDVLIYNQTGAATIYSVSKSPHALDVTAWQNFYKEFTTPAGCVTVRIYLRAGTAAGTAFWIDDILCQGNAIIIDPGNYSVSYQQTKQTHTTGKARVTDLGPIFPRFSLIWQQPTGYLTTAQFDKLLAVQKAKKATWFSDGDESQMVDGAHLYTETTYNYVGISNPSATHVAYDDSSASVPNAADDFETDEFATADYNSIDGDDVLYAEDAATVIGRHQYHVFRFKVTEYTTAEEVRSIHITYKGSCSDTSQKSNNGIILLAWNGTNWFELARARTGDKQTLSFSTTRVEQAQDFVDTTNGYIRIIAMSMGTKGTPGALTLRSYYISVVVNKGLSTAIKLTNKAHLSAAGDVVSVINRTTKATLTLDTHYRIGDDRESVITDSQSAGDYIEVMYDQWYNVEVDNFSEERLPTASAATPSRTATLALESVRGLTD
jgi:hypothetical protein